MLFFVSFLESLLELFLFLGLELFLMLEDGKRAEFVQIFGWQAVFAQADEQALICVKNST